MAFEHKTTEFCSDALTNFAIFFRKKHSYILGWMLTKIKINTHYTPANLAYLANLPNPSVKSLSALSWKEKNFLTKEIFIILSWKTDFSRPPKKFLILVWKIDRCLLEWKHEITRATIAFSAWNSVFECWFSNSVTWNICYKLITIIQFVSIGYSVYQSASFCVVMNLVINKNNLII